MDVCSDPCCEWRVSYFRLLKRFERLRVERNKLRRELNGKE